jgi:hypothetical protein
MKRSITDPESGSLARKLLLVLCLAGSLPALSQSDSTAQRRWFVPDHAVLQLAGNTGMLAAGAGYSIWKDRWIIDLSYGFTPAFDASAATHNINLKNEFRPWHRALGTEGSFVLVPFRVGFGLAYSFGPQFETFWPQRFPHQYYPFPTSLRLLPFLGTALNYRTGNGQRSIKNLELYLDLGTTDLDIANKALNPKLPLIDMLNLAVGVRAGF